MLISTQVTNLLRPLAAIFDFSKKNMFRSWETLTGHCIEDDHLNNSLNFQLYIIFHHLCP